MALTQRDLGADPNGFHSQIPTMSSAINITSSRSGAASDDTTFGFGTSGSPRTRQHFLSSSPFTRGAQLQQSKAFSSSSQTIKYLRSLPAIRERCNAVFQVASTSPDSHFTIDESKLERVADFVISLAKRDYGGDVDKIPPHSRLRQFEVGGKYRIAELLESFGAISNLLWEIRNVFVISNSYTRYTFILIWTQATFNLRKS